MCDLGDWGCGVCDLGVPGRVMLLWCGFSRLFRDNLQFGAAGDLEASLRSSRFKAMEESLGSSRFRAMEESLRKSRAIRRTRWAIVKSLGHGSLSRQPCLNAPNASSPICIPGDPGGREGRIRRQELVEDDPS